MKVEGAQVTQQDSCCCGPQEDQNGGKGPVNYVSPGDSPIQRRKTISVGWFETPAGKVPHISSRLSRADKLDALKVRFNINRMDYTVEPGLYALGEPTADDPVFVSANFKLSFDFLREALVDVDAWILVLDTKGINVWCAAGKGTFGTAELVQRIESTRLKEVVQHRRLILPQLGAPGIAAHEVKERSGFRVRYGPVRAHDIKAFLEAKLKTEETMRTVQFRVYDRLVLTPVEILNGLKYLIIVVAFFLISAGLHSSGYSSQLLLTDGLQAALMIVCAYLGGTFLGPVLLPWLPGRSFSVKGFVVGAGILVVLVLTGSGPETLLDILPWLLIVPAISSFLLMNFTGCSTYTSLSGVLKEMKIALPLQISAASLGIVLWVVGRFL